MQGLTDHQKVILSRWPEKDHPGKRLPYGYQAKPGDSSKIVPNIPVVLVLEEILDQMVEGLSLRDACLKIEGTLGKEFSLSHQGLMKIRARIRPNDPKISRPAKRGRRVTLTAEQKRERKAKDELKRARQRLAFTQKRIEKATAVIEKRDEEKKNELPLPGLYTIPSIIELEKEIPLPAGHEDEEIIFKPSPRQLKFLAAPEFQVLYGGAAGGGKSYALLADAARYIEYPSFNGVLVRRTLPELQELIWESHTLYEPLCLRLYGPNRKPKYSEKNSQWTFPEGGHLKFSYCEQEKDVLQWQGRAFSWAGFDELTQHPSPVAWNYMMSRMRSTDPRLSPLVCMRAATNPGGPGHGWVKKMFIDPAPYDTRFPATNLETDQPMLIPEGDTRYPEERWGTPIFYRRFIPAKLSDNPYLGTDYLSNLMSLPEGLRAQLLDGDWNASEGAAFPEFRRSKHVVQKFDIPPGWRRFRSCDFGYSQKSASCVHWFAVDPNGTLFVYRELYVRQLTARELAFKIREIERGEDISYGILDSSCWDVRGSSGPSIAEEMIHAGTRWRKADKNREAGKNKLHEFLREDEFTGTPGILFFENCKHIISTLEVIPVHPDGKDDTDDKYVDDHSYDSLRYGVMSRPKSTSAWETFNKDITRPRYAPADSLFGY